MGEEKVLLKYFEVKIVIFLTLLFFCGGSHAMGKMCLFSEVHGVVTHNGIPMASADVEQEYRWAWKDEVGTSKTKTDHEGRFSFPAIIKSSFLASFLPHEPVITQTILVKYNGQTYKAWMLDKRDYDNNSELKGKPISLLCELDAPLAHHGNIYGICQPR